MASSGPRAAAGDRAAATREHVLATARALVVRSGISGTSMVEISRTAEVGRTTLYRTWKDLNALLADLLTREAVDVLSAVVGPTGGRPQDVDHVARMLVDVAAGLRDNPVLNALVEHEPLMLSTYVFQRFGTSQRMLLDVFRSDLERVAAADSRLDGRDLDHTARMLMLVIQGAVLAWRLAEPELDRAAWREELLLVVRGYLGADTSEGDAR